MGLNTLPVKVVTSIPDLKLKGVKLKERFSQFIRDTHNEISLMAKEELKDSIRQTDSVVTGKLLESVYRRLLVSKNSDTITSNVGFQKPGSSYAFWANYGREAGNFPPYDVILKWATARGIPQEFVKSIVYSIGHHGTEGKHFMEKAEAKIDVKKSAILTRRIEEFKRSIN